MAIFRSLASTPAVVPQYTGIQIQTSSGAIPIQIIYGLNKVAPNVISSVGFQAIAQYAQSGGKGGVFGGGGGQVESYDYKTAAILGVCEGPIAGVISTFKNNTAEGLVDGVYFNGEPGQVAWSYMSENYPGQALSYPGLAYVADALLDLGSSASMPALYFEVGSYGYTSGSNGADCDPSAMIYDFLTNARYGVLFPTASIDTAQLFASQDGDGSYQSYCNATGLALSAVLSDQETASSILTRWLQLTNSACLWSEGLLKIIPYGDTPVTGDIISYHGAAPYSFSTNTTTSVSYATPNASSVVGTKSFTPNVTPVYALTDDDFVYGSGTGGSDGSGKGDDEDPVNVLRSDPYSIYNWFSLEIYQRSNFYDATPISVFDQDMIDTYGLRIQATITAHEICDENVAQISGELIKNRAIYIRKTYTFKLSWEFCLLEPMDLVTLTQTEMGLNGEVVRIISIEEDENGLLAVTAEEFPAGVATAVKYAVQTKTGGGVSPNADPGSINPPILFEAPYGLAAGLFVYGGVSGANLPTWGGCYVWTSTDGVNYSRLQNPITGPSRMGQSVIDLPPVAIVVGGTNIDSQNPLIVNLEESGATLSSASNADMIAGNTACYIGGEVVAYQDATLTAPNQYTLTPLQRGAFDSPCVDHGPGTPFLRIDDNVFKYPYTATQIGTTLFIKFQSFNTLGGGLQDLSTLPVYNYTITGSPLNAAVETPGNLRTVFSSQLQQLFWDEITDFRGGVRYKVLKGNQPQTAQQVGDLAHPPFVIPGTGTYYVQAYVQPIPSLTVTSAISGGLEITGNLIVENSLEEWDQESEGWPGTAVNMVSTGGGSPILNLGTAINVDCGTLNDPVGTTDDFGSIVNDVISKLDLGSDL